MPEHKLRPLLLLAVCTCLACTKTPQVIEVIDGDTFKTETGETVRLLGINAPEMLEPGGDIAKNALSLLILNERVQLKKDITDTDDYGRLLRYVYTNSIFVNEELVRRGFVETRFYQPDTLHKKLLEETEKVAIRNSKGLWAFSVFQIPDTVSMPVKVFPEEKHKQERISWRDAHKYYGQVRTVEGRIVASNNTGKVCFLNFHENWRKYFTAVIFSSDFDKFPRYPEDYYLTRTVRVTGLIKEYKGKPEIILKSPSQIEIIE